MVRIEGLRDLLEQEIAHAIPTVMFHAQQAPRLPNTSSVVLPGIDGDALLLNLPDVMMGLGSACNSGCDRAVACAGGDAGGARGGVFDGAGEFGEVYDER